MHKEEQPSEDTVTRQLSARQQERPCPKPTCRHPDLSKSHWPRGLWTQCCGLTESSLHSLGLMLKPSLWSIWNTEEKSISQQVLSRTWLHLVFIGRGAVTTEGSAASSKFLCASVSFPLPLEQMTTAQIYSITVLKVRSQKSVCAEVKMLAGGFLLEALEGNLFPCLFQLLVAACIPWFEVASCIFKAHHSISTSISSDSNSCLCLSYKGHCDYTGLTHSPISAWSHQCPCLFVPHSILGLGCGSGSCSGPFWGLVLGNFLDSIALQDWGLALSVGLSFPGAWSSAADSQFGDQGPGPCTQTLQTIPIW